MEDLKPRDPLSATLRFWAIPAALLSFILFASYISFKLVPELSQKDSFVDFYPPYFAAQDLFHKKSPYLIKKDIYPGLDVDRNGGGYFPLMEVIYFPFAPFRPEAAKTLWFIFNLFLTGCAVAFFCFFQKRFTGSVSLAGATLVILGFIPLWRSLQLGQISLVVLSFLLTGFLCVESRKEFWAGLFFALAVLIRPQLGVFVFSMWLKKEWKMLSSFILTLVFSFLLSLVLFGAPILSGFLKEMLTYAGGDNWWSSISPLGLLLRFFTTDIRNADIIPWVQAPWLASALSLVFIFGLMAVSLRSSKVSNHSIVSNLSLWIVTAMLISPRTIDHYLVWLLPPIFFLFCKAFKDNNKKLLGLTALTYLLLDFPTIKLAYFPAFHHGLWLLLSGVQTAGIFLLYFLFLSELNHDSPVSLCIK